MKLGIDPIHFGIMMTVNMEIGMITPPVGLNLYVASGITKMGMTEMTVAVWPWLLTMLVFLVHRHLLAAAVDLAAEDAGHDVAQPTCLRQQKGPGPWHLGFSLGAARRAARAEGGPVQPCRLSYLACSCSATRRGPGRE